MKTKLLNKPKLPNIFSYKIEKKVDDTLQRLVLKEEFENINNSEVKETLELIYNLTQEELSEAQYNEIIEILEESKYKDFFVALHDAMADGVLEEHELKELKEILEDIQELNSKYTVTSKDNKYYKPKNRNRISL